ncbi:Hsp20/alpha crystallin family protein [Acidobacteriota bacterium]
MPTMRWEPFHDLVKIKERMNRLLEEMTARAQGERIVFGTWTPLVDIYEYNDRFILNAELPGIQRKDIEIQIDEEALVLKGQRSPLGDPKNESFYQIEIAYGSFQREFTLPKSVEIDAVEASYRNGILRVTLPKSDVSAAKKIKVRPK